MAEFVTLSLNRPASNDKNIRVCKPHGTHGSLWYFGEDATGAETLSVTGLTLGDYDWVVHTTNISDGSINTSSVNSTSSVTSITLYSAIWGNSTINSVEVMSSGGTAGNGTSPGGDAVAYFLPSTISASATSGEDSFGKTWTVSRSWPASAAYMPSQEIDRSFLHMHRGSLEMANPPVIETYEPFSISLAIRRHWDDNEQHDILNFNNPDGYGLNVKYDHTNLVATFSNSTSSEEVSWDENGEIGLWHVVVIRKNVANGLDLWVDGVQVDSTEATVSEIFANPVDSMIIGEGSSSEWNPRFGFSSFSYYQRYLTEGEIALLTSQLSG